jgi:hypothetical protein
LALSDIYLGYKWKSLFRRGARKCVEKLVPLIFS